MAPLTARVIRSLLERYSVVPSRALGQNFLADPNIAARIARLAEVGAGDRVLEIGPGLGSLTVALAATGARVVALERDRHLVGPLTEVLEGSTVHVETGDALTVDLEALLPGGPWVCVSNLPYNVATPLVVRMLEEVPRIERILVMVQREVGERLAARPGGRAYGAVSVKVAYYARAGLVGSVPARVFVPAPKIASVLVRLDRRAEPPVVVPSVDALFGLVRAGFGQRRKMLRRALEPALGDRTVQVLEAAGVAGTTRAEQLDLEAWAALARAAA